MEPSSSYCGSPIESAQFLGLSGWYCIRNCTPCAVAYAKDEHNLYRAGLGKCKALICVTQDDLTNLEVGLDAKTARPELRVVLRIYDQNLAANLRRAAGIKYTLSMSNIAAERFINMVSAIK